MTRIRQPQSFSTLRNALLLAAAIGAIACAPSRDAAFDPTRAEIEARTGHQARWYDDDSVSREIDESVAALLAEELTPGSAAQIALLNNRGLQARFEDIGVARANLVRATTLANPTVSADVLFPITADEVQGGLGVELDFLSSLFRGAERDIALTTLQATQLAVAGAAIDLTFDARAALLDVSASLQLADVQRRALEAAALRYEVTERLRAAGNITELELLKERAAFEQARARTLEQSSAVIRAQERLTRVLGLKDDTTTWRAPRALPALDDDEAAVADLEARATERSISLELGRRRIDAAGQMLGLSDARRYLPKLDVGAAVEREEDGLRAGPSASISLPLLDQGQGDVAAREAELRRLLELNAASAVRLRAEARRIRAGLTIARERSLLLRDVVPLRAKAIEQAVLQYNAMALGITDLLEQKLMQLEAEREQIEALHEHWRLHLAAEQLLAGRSPSFDLGSEGALAERDSSSSLTISRAHDDERGGGE